MNQANIHHKGVLLWVDDNFIDKPFEEDVDTWVRIFGDESDHIYRLMDLQLRIATTYETGKQAIKELVELEKQGVYIFCIIDLKLPLNHETREFLNSEYGMKMAKLAKENGFNCVFLTTESNRNREQLAEMGLASIPYYSKEQKDQVIPGGLVQHILSNFRSHINWISVKDIYHQLNEESSLFSDTFKKYKDSLSIEYFPFFNVFRAFVERWEYLPVPDRRTVVIFRSPGSHSDTFIQQCLLVTLNNLVQRRPGYVSFRYTRTANPQYSGLIKYTTRGLTVNAVRIDTRQTTPLEFFELLNQALKSNHITYFILPNNEAADEYLEQAGRFRRVSYEDLPTLRVEDTFTREAIIRSAIKLVLQHVKISADDGEEKRLGDIYLAYPQILMNPLMWVLLLEAHKVAEKLTDPFEIVNQIENASQKIQGNQLSPKTRLKLIEGKPIEISNLLALDFDIAAGNTYDEFNKTLQEELMPRTLRLWLTRSWQFPYGMDRQMVQAQNDKNNGRLGFEEKWEEFSFSVLIDLVDRCTLKKCSDELNSVCKFLKHEVIRKLINGKEKEIDDEKWSDLLAVKWPHYEYPMPVALSKKLKKAGRYLWVETDYFNLTRIFPSTRLRHRHLDDVINWIGQSLKWIEIQCDHLPEEWTFYIRKFIHLIVNDQIKTTWKNKQEREALYKDLIDFLNNVVPLSFMAHCILDGHLSGDTQTEKFYKELKGKKGFGAFLGIIREMRKNNLFTHIRPSKYWFFDSRNRTYQFFYRYTQLKDDYCNRVKTDIFIGELKKNHLLQRIYEKMPPPEQHQLLEIIGKENLNPNKKNIVLGKLDVCAREKLYDFLKDKKDLQEIVDCCKKSDVTEMVSQFIKGILDYDGLKHRQKGESHITRILDEISRINAGFSGAMKDTKSCLDFFKQHELSTFFSSTFDVFELSLNAYEKISMTLQRLNYVDGYHFLNVGTWLRNKLKETPPPESYIEIIEFAFELFCFGIEALIAQLKFLLEVSGENQLAEKITLKYVEEIKMPKNMEKPKRDALKKFYKVKKNDGGSGYRVYHLGIQGNLAKEQPGIMLNNEFRGLSERRIIP